MKKIEVYEVGPRDGFQNLKEYIPLEIKLKIISKIVDSGIKNIQHTSFVSTKAIPQLKDSQELTEKCLERFPNVNFFALVPNLKGAEIAWSSGIKSISYVVSLSETHNKANINRTHDESFEELLRIKERLPDMDICLDLSTTFGCPFEHKKNNNIVVPFLEKYVDLGVNEINLCDTIGIANPNEIRKTIKDMKNTFPNQDLQIHIHDTRNMGVINTYAAIKEGISKIQSTLGGLGGCPFAPGASGNLATEDIVYMLNDMDYETNINFDYLLNAAKYQKEVIKEGTFSGHQQYINH